MPRKPDPATAMRQLIGEARAALPFDAPEAQACTGRCEACAAKLLEALEIELDDWERRLQAGAPATLRDLSELAQACRQVRDVLIADGLIEGEARRTGATPQSRSR